MPDNSVPRLKLNIRILPLICVLLAVLYLIDSYRGWSFLLIGLGGVWLISYYWAKKISQGLTLRREMRFGWAQVGDRLEERFTLINNSRLSAFWVEIVDETNLPGYQASQVRSVSGLTKSRWQTDGICTHTRALYIRANYHQNE